MSGDVLEGHAPVVLRAAGLEATFVPGAGMVGVSLRHEGDELLGLRDGLDAYVARGKTMGIPFLHPWANRLATDALTVDGRRVDLRAAGALLRRDEHGLPIHGLLGAAARWTVEETTEASVRASFDSGADPRLDAAFPFPHRVEHAIALAGDALTVTTTLTATGDARVPVAFGFHPYFAPPGADRATWALTLPERQAVGTDERGLPTGERRPRPSEGPAPLGDRALDDGFAGLAAGSELSIAGGGRRIAVELVEGYPAAQAFAPPGAALVALEPMTAPTNALVTGEGLRFAAPGSPFRACFRVRVTPG